MTTVRFRSLKNNAKIFVLRLSRLRIINDLLHRQGRNGCRNWPGRRWRYDRHLSLPRRAFCRSNSDLRLNGARPNYIVLFDLAQPFKELAQKEIPDRYFLMGAAHIFRSFPHFKTKLVISLAAALKTRRSAHFVRKGGCGKDQLFDLLPVIERYERTA